MREKDSRSKTYVVPVAVVAGIGMAGVGLISSGAIANAADSVDVTVNSSCTFNSVTGKNYVGSAANGVAVTNFNESGEHEFNLFCNNHNGYIVTATPYNLVADGIDSAAITYTINYATTGTDGLWTARISSESQGLTVVDPVPVGGGTIISSDSNTSASGVSFTAAYQAYVGSATPAGTYAGRIEYTLTASATSNSNAGTGGSGTGTGGSTNDTPSDPANDTPSDPTNDTNSGPLSTTLNSTNPTYNTYNTYQTSGSTTGTTSGTTAASTGGDNTNSNSGTNDSYADPQGVTSTTKSSSSKSSGAIDPMPIVVAGILVTSGLAAVALVKNNKETEEE